MLLALIIALVLALGGCAYQNPNMYTYGWRPPSGPAPDARSFMGYDPDYEQAQINRYIAAHQQEVQRFRSQQLGM